jgi:hypothetical protein
MTLHTLSPLQSTELLQEQAMYAAKMYALHRAAFLAFQHGGQWDPGKLTELYQAQHHAHTTMMKAIAMYAGTWHQHGTD